MTMTHKKTFGQIIKLGRDVFCFLDASRRIHTSKSQYGSRNSFCARLVSVFFFSSFGCLFNIFILRCFCCIIKLNVT